MQAPSLALTALRCLVRRLVLSMKLHAGLRQRTIGLTAGAGPRTGNGSLRPERFQAANSLRPERTDPVIGIVARTSASFNRSGAVHRFSAPAAATIAASKRRGAVGAFHWAGQGPPVAHHPSGSASSLEAARSAMDNAADNPRASSRPGAFEADGVDKLKPRGQSGAARVG